jgi:hypothetical protein
MDSTKSTGQSSKNGHEKAWTLIKQNVGFVGILKIRFAPVLYRRDGIIIWL